MSYDAPVQVPAVRAIPFIMAPTGSVAANGAITLGTALASTYANAYIYLPAGAAYPNSPAGWYLAQFTSATVGTLFGNMYSSGVPTIPSVPAPLATTGPGAYVGVTGAIAGPQITIPANLLGPNGVLRLTSLQSASATANTKTFSYQIGGAAIFNLVFNTVGQVGYNGITTLFNRGVQNAQVFSPASAGSGTATPAFASINFAVAQTFSIFLNNAVATDFSVVEAFLLEALPG
jgi:hypothetical protein